MKDKCFLETLLKGTFSLIGVKYPKCVLRLSSCNIHLFFKLLDLSLSVSSSSSASIPSAPSSFQKAFSHLFETIRGVLIYAKEGKHDLLFVDE